MFGQEAHPRVDMSEGGKKTVLTSSSPFMFFPVELVAVRVQRVRCLTWRKEVRKESVQWSACLQKGGVTYVELD